MRIAFVITGLDTGGAEMMLLKLLSRLDRDQFDPVLISLRWGGDMAERFWALSIPVYSVGMDGGGILPIGGLFRLVALMRRLRPDLVQGWMCHGNIAAQCGALFLRRRVPVLWNVRVGLGNLEQEKRLTALMVWLGGRLSHLPERIINNSAASASEHEQRFGYRADKRFVIPNGFDTEMFRPSAEARIRLRRDLGLPESALLIGMVGRYHTQKNHRGFLCAAADLHATHPNVVFVLAGAAVDRANRELMQWIEKLRLDSAVRLLGKRDDMPQVMAALDLLVCCSVSEGFPNVVGEAMSCGVPCAVTDVVDCAWIVGETGKVVPPGDPATLAGAMRELVESGMEGRQLLGERARQRIVENFSLDAVVATYESVYKSVVRQRRGD